MFDNSAFATTGTTTPILIPRHGGKPIRPDRDYFFIQIIGAQAVFSGNILEQVNHLVITSQINLNHPALGNQEILAIQRSREVRRDRAEMLGLSPNLISLVPATMTHVSISIDFILDKKNRLLELAGLINDDSFLTAISLAPGVAMVAKTIGGLAQKVINTFMPAEERQPILQFKGDFNIGEDDFQDGYYAVLGTRDAVRPLPNPIPPLTVQSGGLLVNGVPLNLSYVILRVGRTEARGRERNDNAPWDRKLRQTEDLANQVARDRSMSKEQRVKEWENCKKLLLEARALLLADLNYTREEADNIYWSTWDKCENALLGNGANERSKISTSQISGGWIPDLQEDRAFLEIPPANELETRLTGYAEQVFEARRILKDTNLV